MKLCHPKWNTTSWDHYFVTSQNPSKFLPKRWWSNELVSKEPEDHILWYFPTSQNKIFSIWFVSLKKKKVLNLKSISWLLKIPFVWKPDIIFFVCLFFSKILKNLFYLKFFMKLVKKYFFFYIVTIFPNDPYFYIKCEKAYYLSILKECWPS